jgi:hypothetical protein
MKEISIGGTRYRLIATGHDVTWKAHAERAQSGERFGIECAGVSESDAIDRLAAWLDWQHEHAAALEALQQAEDAYHRTIAGSAFASPTEGPSPHELQRESLEQLKDARQRLDEVRLREPEPTGSQAPRSGE